MKERLSKRNEISESIGELKKRLNHSGSSSRSRRETGLRPFNPIFNIDFRSRSINKYNKTVLNTLKNNVGEGGETSCHTHRHTYFFNFPSFYWILQYSLIIRVSARQFFLSLFNHIHFLQSTPYNYYNIV